jgi:hypothetical protein
VTKGWTRAKASTAYLGTETDTTTRGAALRLPKATFDRIALVVTRCPTCGHVAIYLGNTLWRTVNTYAATTRHQVLLLEPSFGTRTTTITLRTTNSKKRVRIDGLAVTRN